MQCVCNQASGALLVSILPLYGRYILFYTCSIDSYSRHHLETHLQAGSPVVTEMQIPAALGRCDMSNEVRMNQHEFGNAVLVSLLAKYMKDPL